MGWAVGRSEELQSFLQSVSHPPSPRSSPLAHGHAVPITALAVGELARPPWPLRWGLAARPRARPVSRAGLQLP